MLKVRLANIDTPEKGQAFGERSRQSLSDLYFGKDATFNVQDIDRCDRTVAVVKCKGIEANREQVERGLSWVSKYNKDRTLVPLFERVRWQRIGLFSMLTDQNKL